MSREQTPVDESVQQLLVSIRASEPYRHFEKAKEQIEGHEEEKRMIDSFRRDAFLFSNSVDPLNNVDEMNRLQLRRQEIRKNPLIADYLAAELELCRMLQDICNAVIGITDLQIDDFMDAIEL